MPVRIYGAGMAGLLTAAMLRRLRPVVYEAQEALPDNHGALLRFRTDAVQQETGQPFHRVRVLKAVKHNSELKTVSTLRDANLYSHKVTGAIRARSVLDLSPCDRYIAPPNFIDMMARDAILKMNAPLTGEGLAILKQQSDGSPIISTIPMPLLMKIVGWPNPPAFAYRPIWSVTVDIAHPATDVYQTVYYPSPGDQYYRASITGARLILEYAMAPANAEADVRDVLLDFGIFPLTGTFTLHEAKHQTYGKLLPLDDKVRQEFILAMTDEYNIYSVGRFATWRQILLDDVVQDVRKVERWITQRSSYARRLDLCK